MKEEYIFLPLTLTELNRVNKDYNTAGLPGCVGSMDVVHVKWSHCPTGNHNCAKGKEGYPTLGFQCITDFNRRVMAIYRPQFGSRNDKDIVKHNDNVRAIRQNSLFTNPTWQYYDCDKNVWSAIGMYLICDNGYLLWPTSIDMPVLESKQRHTGRIFFDQFGECPKGCWMYFRYFKEAVKGAESWIQTSRHCKNANKFLSHAVSFITSCSTWWCVTMWERDMATIQLVRTDCGCQGTQLMLIIMQPMGFCRSSLEWGESSWQIIFAYLERRDQLRRTIN